MINYTSQNQLKLELFKHPFETELDKENRWVKLAEVIPWDKLAAVYGSKLRADRGRRSVNIRTVIAALIIKHTMGLDDRGTIEMIQENIYMQYFCGLEGFTTQPVFDPSLFVKIRKRLGGAEFDKMNRSIIEEAERMKPHQSRIMSKKRLEQASDEQSDKEDKEQPAHKSLQDKQREDKDTEHKNRGTLKLDATVANQEIKYPNDVSLLNDSRLQLERMISQLYEQQIDGKRPRIYSRKALKEYINFSKKRKKTKKEIRRAVKSQLQYIRRDLRVLAEMLEKKGRQKELNHLDMELLEVIMEVYRQQKEMYDNKTHRIENRIVSLSQPWIRPMVRGKDKAKVEFGSKINVSEVAGFCRINHLMWDPYNEGILLREQVEAYKEFYGYYPLYLLADTLYLNRENKKYLKERGIKITGKSLGRPPVNEEKPPYWKRYRNKKKSAERNTIEGKFGQGKRGYGLNNIQARLKETSESWINAIFMVMNVIKLLEVAEKWGQKFFYYLFLYVRRVLYQKNIRLGVEKGFPFVQSA